MNTVSNSTAPSAFGSFFKGFAIKGVSLLAAGATAAMFGGPVGIATYLAFGGLKHYFQSAATNTRHIGTG